MAEESKALTIVDNFSVPQVLTGDDVQEEMDGLTFRFSYIKVPSGGGLAFEVPGDDDDDPDLVKEITGVIVCHHPVNAFWSEEYTGGNEPPDCSSLDGRIGVGNPGGYCKNCPMNEWGSGRDGEGKACNNRRRIYLLREGEMFPLLLSLPPTSLGNFSDLISRKVLQKGLRSYAAIVKAKLKKATNRGGIEYSQVTWSVTGKLADPLIAQMIEYGENVKILASGLTVDEVEGKEEEIA